MKKTNSYEIIKIQNYKMLNCKNRKISKENRQNQTRHKKDDLMADTNSEFRKDFKWN